MAINVNLWHTEHKGGKITEAPHPAQQQILDSNARFKVIVCGRRWGKDYAIDTPTLTTKGWKTCGELEPGDYVFGPDGLPAKIIETTPVMIKEYSYRITFSDGSEVITSPEHDWVVEDRNYRKSLGRNVFTRRRPKKMTTEEISKSYLIKRRDGGFEHNYSIPVAEPLVLREKNYILEPYLLGYWLGDGASGTGMITTADEEVLNEYRNAGYFIHRKGKYDYGIYHSEYVKGKKNKRITDILGKIGVLNNKHIPVEYQLGSIEQRLSLVQGLVDSDGNIEPNGRCEFISTNKVLATDFRRLISTLGIKSTIGEYDATLKGRVVGKKYRVKFTTLLEVARLRRKLCNIKPKHKTDVSRRFIINVEKIDAVPTKCIGVDNSSHQFLVGDTMIPTHNTLLAIISILLNALNHPNGLYWYIAPTYRQAKNIAWRLLMSKIRLFPRWWQERCRVEKNNLMIELPNHSIIELKGAQEPDSLVGSGLDGVVLDEYAMDVYGVAPVWKEAIRPALSDKNGWAIFISSPRGYNHFFELYDYAQTQQEEGWASWKMPTRTNPYITKKELEAAKREVGEDLFSQEYEAEFKKRSGLVYKEFSREKHVIDPIEPKDIPGQWQLEIGLDFGASHPTAALFIMFDHVSDTAYVVDEHYESEWTTDRHVSAIMAKEDKWLMPLRRKRTKRIGDSQAKQTLLDYASKGYYITPTLKGSDSVDEGISVVRKRLEIDDN